LLLCFALTGILIPVALKLPSWIQAEIVFAAWWIIWVTTLSWMLYTRALIRSDYEYHKPQEWFPSSKKPEPHGSYSSGWWDGYLWGNLTSHNDSPVVGCMAILLLIVLLPWIIWFVVEVAIPGIAFLMYFVIRGMLAHVVNDRHGCQKHLGRSLGWGALWATIYTAPLMLAVWGVHWVASR
jgi:hypothetical protein